MEDSEQRVFQVDTILKSVKELEKQKSDKELLLSGLCDERIKLEKQLKELQLKHATVNSEHSSSVEKLKISEQRMIELERQMKLYENINDEKRMTISKLTQQLDHEDIKEQKEIHSFEETMATLSDQFRTAVHFYTVPSLDKEIQSKESLREILKEKSTNIEFEHSKLKEINKDIDDDYIILQEKEKTEEIINEKNQAIILSMYNEVISNYHFLKESSTKKQSELLQVHNRLKDELKDIQSTQHSTNK